MPNNISPTQVAHIAKLANIPVSEAEIENLATGFTSTLNTIEDLKTIDTSGVVATSQVTGLENIWREDQIENSRTFTQDQALANAKKTYQGYFVVPRLIKKS